MGQELTTNAQTHEDVSKRVSGFTPKQVEMIRERFELMCDEDQTVELETFSKLMKIPSKEAEVIFKFFDMDSSGKIDSYEFICGLALLSHSTLEEKAEIVFNLYDFDKSQLITKNELVILVKTVLTSLASMAKKNPPTIKEVESQTETIFNRWDTNKDHSISLDEFKSFVTKDPDILKLMMSYGLVNKEELRPDFGCKNEDVPECDSDLEEEIAKKDPDCMDEKTEKIKMGHTDPDALFETEQASEGDQFMAVKPWVGAVKNSVPSSYKPSKNESTAPEASLTLDYVHGYRAFDCRNNIRFNKDGDIVYHTAAVGITLNTKNNTQKFFIQHTDDITAFDMWGDLCVTGQMGKKPLICVWDCVKMEMVLTFKDELQNSISHVCFSNDGKKIAAIANDPDHTIAIYNIEKLRSANYNRAKARGDGTIMVGNGPKCDILQMKFDPSDSQLVIAGNKEVNFVTFDTGAIKFTKGTTGGKTPLPAVLCIGFIDQTCITGTFAGNLIIWKGKSMNGVPVQAHQGVVNAIWSRKSRGLLTGGNDCVINIWNQSVQKVGTIDLKTLKLDSMSFKVRAICESTAGVIAVGTKGGEIVEITMNNNNPTGRFVMKGHFDEELWGLCVSPNPKKNEFFTVGQDLLLASWDITNKRQKSMLKLDYKATVLAISPDEKFLAVGCMNGFVLILNPGNFTLVQTLKDRDKQISALSYNSTGELLAAGAHDSEVFVYNVKKNFKIQCKLRGNHSTITHLDFSMDGRAIQTNSTSYEILFYDTEKGKRKNAPEVRDEEWDTYTCTIGWAVQGIWPKFSDGSDINAVDRHPDKRVLATGDDFSHVRLLRYPCPVEQSSDVQFTGHSSHVTNVKFTKNGNYLISTGGNDKSIFQWKYNFDEKGDKQATTASEEDIQKVDDGEGENMFQVDEDPGEGDQALAIKPFLGQVKNSIPEAYKKPTATMSAIPDGNLKLRYCHGYRCFNAGTTVRACGNPNLVVFAGAALGVVMDTTSKRQSFFTGHEDDVLSIAIHPEGKICATGQIARKGKAKAIDIFVWEIESKNVLARINDFHKRAILLLEFSPSGKYLLTVGGDDDNTCAIYDWAQKILVATCKSDQIMKAKPEIPMVTGGGFKNDSAFFTCGPRHVKFYNVNGRNINAQRGSYPETLQSEGFLCGTFLGDICFIGTGGGNLLPFSGNSALKSVAAHKGSAVLSVAVSGKQLISGGKDGKVTIWEWGTTLTPKVEVFFDAKNLSKFNPGIFTLSAKADGSVFVGTRGGEIYEVNKNGKADLLLRGHYDGELWGLATHPKENKYVTCGGDKTIRTWDASTDKHAMIKYVGPLDADVRAIDWSPNGEFIIAIDFDGKIQLFDNNLTPLDTIQAKSVDKKGQWAEDIKFSPDSTKAAFGTHLKLSPIEIVNIKNKKLEPFKVHKIGLTSSLLHLDWSTDSDRLQVVSQAYELLFIQAETGQQVNASATKDTDWYSQTCKFGWSVQGIWKGVDYSDINAVARSNNRKYLATAGDDGCVNLLKYPCVVEKAKFKDYLGHSSHVTRVKFLFNDTRVISTGGNDKCVLVWDTDFGVEGNQSMEEVQQQQPEEEKNDDEPVDYEDSVKRRGKRDKYGKNTKKKDEATEEQKLEEEEDNLFQVQKVDGGDEFSAVRPWLGQIAEPSDWKKAPLDQTKAPKAELVLEHVHGYRAKDCCNNVRYLKNGSIVYHAAAVGIVVEPNTSNQGASVTQKFFIQHSDDIISMALHPNGVWVATGELGPKPVIHMWDTCTMKSVFTLKGGLMKGINSLAFSPNGKYLVGTAIDNDHYVGVYDAEAGTFVSCAKGGPSPILETCFVNDTDFVTVGAKHFMYWTLTDPKNPVNKKGIFGDQNNLLRCVTVNEGAILAGDSKGQLQIWAKNSLTDAKKLHEGNLDAIWVDHSYIFTGGSDCVINILDKSYVPIATFNLEQVVKTICGKVRSICMSSDQKKTLLVGTLGSEVYELTPKDSKIVSNVKFIPKEIVKGHYTPNTKWTNEVWGLCVFKKNLDLWATCSDDGTLRVWSVTKKAIARYASLNVASNEDPLPLTKDGDLDDSAKGRCVDICPEDKTLVVGCKNGTIRVLYADTLKHLKIFKPSNEWISDVKFSPDGTLLAAGSHDNNIYIFTVQGWQKKTTFSKHHSFITHLDWSRDGQCLHSDSGDYELLYWDVSKSDATNGYQEKSGKTKFRDEAWASWTTVIGWPVQGIWPPGTSGDDINAVHRSNKQTPGNYHLLAAGDDFGKVNLFRYPCVQKNSQAIKAAGHSSHVTNVRFAPNDAYLFSTGGEDNCVFQWKVNTGATQ